MARQRITESEISRRFRARGDEDLDARRLVAMMRLAAQECLKLLPYDHPARDAAIAHLEEALHSARVALSKAAA